VGVDKREELMFLRPMSLFVSIVKLDIDIKKMTNYLILIAFFEVV